MECTHVWTGYDNAIKILNARSKAEDWFTDVLDVNGRNLGKDPGSGKRLESSGLGENPERGFKQKCKQRSC
jgi:hypothetical protein